MRRYTKEFIEDLPKVEAFSRRQRRPFSWVRLLRGLGWALVTVMLAFALVGVIVMSVPIPD